MTPEILLICIPLSLSVLNALLCAYTRNLQGILGWVVSAMVMALYLSEKL